MKCYNCLGEGHMAKQCTQPKRPRSSQTIPHNSAFQIEDLDAYDSDCNDISSAKAVLMENLSSCDSDVLSKESQNTDKEIQTNKRVNESLTAELERYKERDDTHKQALGYQNPFHLKKAQRIKPTLYDGSFIAKEHDVIFVIDDEETLILEEESRSKMLDKQNDLILTKTLLKLLSIDNDQLLKQIMSQEIMHIAVNSVDILNVNKSCVDECNKCLELETELLKKKDLIEKDVYDKLFKSYSTLKKHCISLELTTQLNQEIFQRGNFRETQNAPIFNQLFKINELKAQSQEKDTVIRKLKDRIKSLSGKDSVKNIDEIETIKIELEHSVAQLLSENENLRKEREHLKSIYKDQFDSIRKTRVHSNEHCASLIAQINEKSVENSDLNAQVQEKVFAIAALKNELRKLKGKNVFDTAVSKPSATIAPGMFKLDIGPISRRLKNNRDAHGVYLEKTIENTNTLRGLELLVYVSKTCPSLTKPTKKLVAVTPINKDKKIRFAEPVTSSSNIPKQTDSLKTKDSNKPLLTSTGVKPTTSTSGSKPSGNTKKNRIS
ncbi:retrovirus-related pol polyprotein from transposon TNT 1-94 [Tanacetum coccineum]